MFDAEPILRVLVEHRVDFVVIGGMAAYFQGSPLPTLDVDVTPEVSADNLQRLSDALRALDARVRRPDVPEGLPFAHDATSLAGSVFWNLTTAHGDLDVSFTPAGTKGFADLAQNAGTVVVGSTRVPVASLADVVRSKDAADRPKDRRALPVLRELLAQQTLERAGRARRTGGQ